MIVQKLAHGRIVRGHGNNNFDDGDYNVTDSCNMLTYPRSNRTYVYIGFESISYTYDMFPKIL